MNQIELSLHENVENNKKMWSLTSYLLLILYVHNIEHNIVQIMQNELPNRMKTKDSELIWISIQNLNEFDDFKLKNLTISKAKLFYFILFYTTLLNLILR